MTINYLSSFCQLRHLLCGKLVIGMSVDIHCYSSVGMSHQILKSFNVHSVLSHARCKGMSRNVWRDVWQDDLRVPQSFHHSLKSLVDNPFSDNIVIHQEMEQVNNNHTFFIPSGMQPIFRHNQFCK